MIKTNQIQQLASVLGTDSLLLDTAAAGTGRLTMDKAAAFFGTELVKPTNPVGAALSDKADWERLPGQNLLDNWCFLDPINQRGKTEYAGNIYGIDRWIGYNDTTKAVITSEGISIRKLTDDGLHSLNNTKSIIQVIDPHTLAQLKGKLVTCSMLIANGTSGGRAGIGLSAGTISESFLGDVRPLTGGPQLVSVTGTIPTDITALRVFLGRLAGASDDAQVTIAAAKLELGDTQTLAHQDVSGEWVLNDPPPNKALELAKCQRYQIFGPLRAQKIFTYNADDKIGIFFPLPTPMRATPSLVGSLVYTVDGTNTPIPYTGKIELMRQNNGTYGYLSNSGVDFSNVSSFALRTSADGLDANL